MVRTSKASARSLGIRTPSPWRASHHAAKTAEMGGELGLDRLGLDSDGYNTVSIAQ
jgi:hypothetical protein